MKTLIIIDIQNDFLPGGALAVTGGNQIVPLINELMSSYDHVVTTQDFHPADHGSFAANHDGHAPGKTIDLNGLNQILWPTHCVQGTPGADFAPGLNTSGIDHIFQKGTDPKIDSYSGFFDNGHRKPTGLADYLRKVGASEVHIAGLATDYCVKFTALDAVTEGFKTTLITDACRGVNLTPGDVDKAIEEMRVAGVTITDSDTLQHHLEQMTKERDQKLTTRREEEELEIQLTQQRHKAEKQHRQELLELKFAEWNNLHQSGADLTAVLVAQEHNPDKTIRLDQTGGAEVHLHEAI